MTIIHLADRESLQNLDGLDLSPDLRRLLAARVASLDEELLDLTEIAVIHATDTEAELIERVGYTPLKEPHDAIPFGARGFWPHWDWLVARDTGRWYELAASFGSSFAYILLIEDTGGPPDELRRLCRHYASPRPVA